jgi:hypothetical protein
MQGEGTYTYKKANDIYSGTWLANKKHGEGTYEYGNDKSILIGTWENGFISSGKWVLKDAAVYDGNFKVNRPFGPGKFSFESGLVQTGSYVEQKLSEEDEAAAGDEEGVLKPPNVAWKGDSIVSF